MIMDERQREIVPPAAAAMAVSVQPHVDTAATIWQAL
jgi:hypothetical protein